MRKMAGLQAIAMGLLLTGAVSLCAQGKYPKMAPVAEYREARAGAEIALARSAAPPSISDNAEVLVMGARGYERAAAGTNGFVCVVERSWATEPGDAEFWNTKIRAPICFNPAAARSVLPDYLKRSEWVLAGVSEDAILERTKAAVAAKTLPAPEPGAMCYMMSKQGYLNDRDVHWHPHLMFFTPHTADAAWGANLHGSPVLAAQGKIEPGTVFFIPVMHWSDGTPAPMM
jgi:hypothetical protein